MLFWWELYAFSLSFQSAILLFSCHAQLFLNWIYITEGDTLLCMLSKAWKLYLLFYVVYIVFSHIIWTQAVEAEKNSWIDRFMIFLFSKYYYGDQIKQHVAYMGNNRYAYGILRGGDLKECAWKLWCRCEVNIKTNLKYNEPAWTTIIWFWIGISGWLLHTW
jgi:hypothetical protein